MENFKILDDGIDIAIFYFILWFIGFIICVFITRWIFRMDAIVGYERKQFMLLKQIALKLKVDPVVIDEIEDPELFKKKRQEMVDEKKEKYNEKIG